MSCCSIRGPPNTSAWQGKCLTESFLEAIAGGPDNMCCHSCGSQDVSAESPMAAAVYHSKESHSLLYCMLALVCRCLW